jgi:uncharacterized membrane protein
MAESLSEPAQAVVMGVSIIALLFGVVQLGTGTLFGVLPILIGIIGVIYLDGGLHQVAEWIKQEPPLDATQETPKEDALAVLRERYARGELTQEEFERRLEELLETETISDAADHCDREPLTERSG